MQKSGLIRVPNNKQPNYQINLKFQYSMNKLVKFQISKLKLQINSNIQEPKQMVKYKMFGLL